MNLSVQCQLRQPPLFADSFSIGIDHDIVGSGERGGDEEGGGGDERPDGSTDRTADSTPSATDRSDAEEDDTRSNHQSDDEDNVSRGRDRDSVDSRSEDGDSDVAAENENGDDESDAIIDADERGDSDDDVVEVTGVTSCSSSKFHSELKFLCQSNLGSGQYFDLTSWRTMGEKGTTNQARRSNFL